MQVVELAGIILALSIQVLVDIILAQPLKIANKGKTAWPSFHKFVAAKKLYYLAKPMHLEVLTPKL